MDRLRFTVLLNELRAAYPQQPRAFHVLAARYYLGADNVQDLRRQAKPYPIAACKWTGDDQMGRPSIDERQVQAIVGKR